VRTSLIQPFAKKKGTASKGKSLLAKAKVLRVNVASLDRRRLAPAEDNDAGDSAGIGNPAAVESSTAEAKGELSWSEVDAPIEAQAASELSSESALSRALLPPSPRGSSVVRVEEAVESTDESEVVEKAAMRVEEAVESTDESEVVEEAAMRVEEAVESTDESEIVEKAAMRVEEALLFAGASILKDFGEFGVFEGVMQRFDPDTAWWRVLYPADGEEEDLTEEELLPLRLAFLEHESQPAAVSEDRGDSTGNESGPSESLKLPASSEDSVGSIAEVLAAPTASPEDSPQVIRRSHALNDNPIPNPNP
jgi:hypothetical protein